MAIPALRRSAPAHRLARLAGALLLLLAAVAAPSVAQRADGDATTRAAPGESSGTRALPAGRSRADSAELIVRGRPIVAFRAPLGALLPAERVAAAARRIDHIAERFAERGESEPVGIRTVPEGVLVTVGDQGVFTLTRADLTDSDSETIESAALRAATRLRGALALEQEERSLTHLLKALGLAVGATLLFLVLLRILRRARRASRAVLTGAARARLPRLAVGTYTVLTREQVTTIVRRLVDLVTLVAGFIAAYLWLAFVLTRFSFSRAWGELLGTYLGTTAATLALRALAAVPDLFVVVLILVAARWVSRLVGGFFDAVEAGTVEVPWIHPETANPTKRIAIAATWLFAAIVAYPYLPGSGSDAFKGITVFAGLVLSLGSTGVMNQAMSGLVLMYTRALRPGDFVRVGEVEGTVSTLGMLSTKIRTAKNEEVTVPNAVVVAANIKNYSRADEREGSVLLHTTVTIGYDTPWRQVEAMLRIAAERTEGLVAEPPPFVLVTALSDFYVEYQLNARLDEPARRMAVLSALHVNVLDVFNEHGVQITSPHYEADPPSPTVVPRERWYAAPARPPGRPEDAAG